MVILVDSMSSSLGVIAGGAASMPPAADEEKSLLSLGSGRRVWLRIHGL
jgi:hypothetical protein